MRTALLALTFVGILVESNHRTVSAQSPGGEATALDAAGRDEAEHSGRRWYNLWTQRSIENRVIWGMWSTHLNRADDPWKNTRALALVYDGLYAATFRTTHGPRAYTVGIERTWATTPRGPVKAMIGYRAGLVYGYDGRLGWAAELTPILPFVQPVAYARMGPFTTDIAYTWVVIAVTVGLRF